MNYVIYNPNNKPIEELPIIFGFNNGGSKEWLYAELIAEDGTPLGAHICSHENYMRGTRFVGKFCCRTARFEEN